MKWFSDQREKNRGILDIKLGQWIENAVENRILAAHRGKPITELVGVLAQKPVLLLGPGPSLDLATPYLVPQTDEITLMACNTALNPLGARGIVPDYIVAYDGAPEVAAQMREYVNCIGDIPLKSKTLICPVTIHPGVPLAWPGEIVWFLPHDATTPETTTFTKSVEYMFPNQQGLPNVSCVFILMIALAAEMKADVTMSVGFELPIVETAIYGAARYDLTERPPKPLGKAHKTMSRDYIWLHRGYIAGVLDILRLTGLVFVNLSPLASFRDFVVTKPPSIIASGFEEPDSGKN